MNKKHGIWETGNVHCFYFLQYSYFADEILIKFGPKDVITRLM
jgi:hypothetical protein